MNTPLVRSASDKFIGGVCGGLARSLGVDSGIVRVVTVLLAIFTQVGWVAYLVLWAILPLEQGGPTGVDEAKKLFNNGSGGSSGAPHNGDDLR
ncbi:MAG: PspC domain-containing protein [Propionicimonas sp.]|uniref:PspC domain-containing protein n=1 Tax=Propionicimonas sp. TaxID=1955623 RepID=UPI002B1F384A|nr:PspC domain-containing protein [Propionicimonas sp.]MEA4943208.1 PspC domain-containing protein [Propionicimonas sp.]MEA5055407.1 PspC domain-containing protein [Propionicimonas sp.]MEA5119569.1 PspC domain-containing protein [Propionicimonas sp.]